MDGWRPFLLKNNTASSRIVRGGQNFLLHLSYYMQFGKDRNFLSQNSIDYSFNYLRKSYQPIYWDQKTNM